MILMKDNIDQHLNSENIVFLIIHCSDTPDNQNLNALDILLNNEGL